MKPEQKGKFFADWWPEANKENDFLVDLDVKKSKSFTGSPASDCKMTRSSPAWGGS